MLESHLGLGHGGFGGALEIAEIGGAEVEVLLQRGVGGGEGVFVVEVEGAEDRFGVQEALGGDEEEGGGGVELDAEFVSGVEFVDCGADVEDESGVVRFGRGVVEDDCGWWRWSGSEDPEYRCILRRRKRHRGQGRSYLNIPLHKEVKFKTANHWRTVFETFIVE
jgi:hypothetical protein